MGIRERLDEVMKLSPEELRRLPESTQEESERVGGREIQYILWHDQAGPGVHRFVVGRYDMSISAGWNNVAVDGFALLENGQIRPLTEIELREFN